MIAIAKMAKVKKVKRVKKKQFTCLTCRTPLLLIDRYCVGCGGYINWPPKYQHILPSTYMSSNIHKNFKRPKLNELTNKYFQVTNKLDRWLKSW